MISVRFYVKIISTSSKKPREMGGIFQIYQLIDVIKGSRVSKEVKILMEK